MTFIKLETYDNQTVVIDREGLVNAIEPQTLEQFMDDYVFDDSDYFFNYHIKAGQIAGFKVLGYFIAEEDMEAGEVNGATIFVAIDEGHDRLTCYSPIGQHSEMDRDYLEACVSIPKERYLEIAGPNGTPADYL